MGSCVCVCVPCFPPTPRSRLDLGGDEHEPMICMYFVMTAIHFVQIFFFFLFYFKKSLAAFFFFGDEQLS